MKKVSKSRLRLAGILVFLFGAISCSKNYLSVDHYSLLAADQMFKSDADAQAGMAGCYDMMIPVGATDGDWGFKPNLFVGGHPTMETQATGWDKQWNSEDWNSSSPELLSGWTHCYAAITRANNFLAGLGTATAITPSVKTSLDGQARCVRAFFYMWLAETFGTVPMLNTGETYINTPVKARAKTYGEMWNFIINDLNVAAGELDWDPQSGQYGRTTKGFALSYLGEAYLWKAYRVPDSAADSYTKGAAALLQVINSGKYALNASYTTLFDPGAVWTKESIWEEVLDQGSQWNQWANLTDAHDWTTYYSASPADGGWGSLYLSWEFWSAFEPGDKRREASGATGNVTNINPAWKSATNYGFNPYLQQPIASADGLTSHYHYMNGGEPAPAIWSLKWWRSCRADWNAMWGPEQIYYKRYANVLLDYAECLFHVNGPNDATAWGYVNQIRNRAFGNLEVGQSASLTATYLPYYQTIATFYQSHGDNSVVVPTQYPLPFNTTTVTVPDAQAYYTSLKGTKGFTSPVWLVALGEERRKEFNAEWSLRPDLQRSGYLFDHILHNYPKGAGYPNTNPLVQDSWNTYRAFDTVSAKMDFPIPQQELLKNPLCDQNAAYK